MTDFEVSNSKAKNCAGAAERFFRLYKSHTVATNTDTLFVLLNAIHSLNDRLKKSVDINFFDVDEFVALKALRNLFHHEQELISEVRAIPVIEDMPIYSDLLIMCLTPSSLVLQAIEMEEKWRPENRPRIEGALKWYGSVVDINPAIFNFAVHAYEKLRKAGVSMEDDAIATFEASYQYEEDNGFSHFVSGDIYCRAGDVTKVLRSIYLDAIQDR